jgi:diguanylate cyclase (GGDEF)-like protein
MSDLSFRPNASASADAAQENALLRAALDEAQRRIAELEGAAEADPLTGLPNAVRFRRGVERVVGQAARHGTAAALLSIDLLGLGEINERHGRLAGDAAIVHVGRLLSGLIRSTDLLARLEGGNFALLLDHLDHDSAIDTAERLARCIAADSVRVGSTPLRIEAAVAATSILAGDTLDDVLNRAARNLVAAKDG